MMTEEEITLIEQAAEYILAVNANRNVVIRTEKLPRGRTLAIGLRRLARKQKGKTNG